MEDVKVSLFLDTRKSRRTNEQKRRKKFSVSLRIWDPMIKQAKIRKTRISMTEEDFNNVWHGKRLNAGEIAQRGMLQEALMQVHEALSGMDYFNYEQLDRKLSTPKGEEYNILWHLDRKVELLRAEGRIGTSDTYKHTAKWIRKFTRSSRLSFKAITPRWLDSLENWALDEGKSITTVGMYTRNIRAIFNDAIEEKIVDRELYPFGRRRYVPPTGMRVKKALSGEQLRELLNAEPRVEEQQMAKDFFFFSYASNGMNIHDIVHLQNKNLDEDSFSFIRRKTRRSRRESPAPIVVYFNPIIESVIAKYGNTQPGNKYVFPFITEEMSPEEQYLKVRNFTRFVNQHIKNLARENGLPEISTYWARHSFATIAINKGASLEFMQECLGHADPNTTLNYFAGFNQETKRDFAKSLLDF